MQRQNLIKNKKITKDKTYVTAKDFENLPDLPNGWLWIHLNELLATLKNGISIPPNAEKGISILRISALRPNSVNTQDIRFLAGEVHEYQDYLLVEEDLLFTRYSGNKNFVGICGVVPPLKEVLVYPDKLIRGRLITGYLIAKYISIAVNIGESRAYVNKRLKTTAGQVGIAGKDIKTIPIPLPPLNEQRRIVAKVEQLMDICDELEVKLIKSYASSEKLMDAVADQILMV
ncbi:restriction endonuclease subunit S [Nostoc punctiforme FACHB-252]|uniref:Restriction endonuclease subunit S n=1 Tax=Nostoc punctiforme FACHB-252 TaxID=1357509 RepID=A0ABR8HMH4_NOSPU|nr:restriction endonuclease subunit S [Nostoc punctiforme]MBD2616576.1 restriction endonuclease subunit S [Nostoc punctiforme FACHB-252]